MVRVRREREGSSEKGEGELGQSEMEEADAG